MAFDFKRSLIKVQGGRTYLPVSARIVWFREEHPDWGIRTELVAIDTEKQYAIFRAEIFNAEGKLMATATKMENVKGFPDYLEKAETGSVGRALALCGFGTQFEPELDEVSRGRLADSPQPMGGGRPGGGGSYGNSGGNRYGNGGGGYNNGGNAGSRFAAPPREVSGPADDRDEAEAPRRPAPGPSPAASAPASVVPAGRGTGGEGSPPVADEDDDFEALVNEADLLDDAENDPFNDTPGTDKPVAAPRVAAPKADAPAKPAVPAGNPACVECGKALTRGQMDLSIRNYGEALCPGCQKDKPRLTGRTAVAER